MVFPTPTLGVRRREAASASHDHTEILCVDGILLSNHSIYYVVEHEPVAKTARRGDAGRVFSDTTRTMSDTQRNGMTVAEHSHDVQPRTPDGREIETENVAGGYLVFARCEERVGRELIGFADVSEWSLIRTSLAKRGLGVGAVHNLETYAPEEVGL